MAARSLLTLPTYLDGHRPLRAAFRAAGRHGRGRDGDVARSRGSEASPPSDPEIETGYAAALALGDLARLPVEFLAVSRSRVSRRLLRAARRRGVEIHVWTLNRTAAMVEVIQEGVDGIITDRPALAVRVVREMEEMPALARLLLRFGSLAIDEEETGEATAPPGGRSVPGPSSAAEAGSEEAR